MNSIFIGQKYQTRFDTILISDVTMLKTDSIRCSQIKNNLYSCMRKQKNNQTNKHMKTYLVFWITFILSYIHLNTNAYMKHNYLSNENISYSKGRYNSLECKKIIPYLSISILWLLISKRKIFYMIKSSTKILLLIFARKVIWWNMKLYGFQLDKNKSMFLLNIIQMKSF